MFVCLHRREIERSEVVQRRGEGERAPDVGCAGLEAIGNVVVGRAGEAHDLDHVASALPRRHRLEQIGASIKRAYTGRAKSPVPGKRVEIAAHGNDVDGAMDT